MKLGYIYCLTDKQNGKKYVGQHRAMQFDISYFGSGRIIKDMAKKHNLQERFLREILDWCYSFQDLDIKEKIWIEKLNTLHPNGYNLTTGGEQSKCYSEETKNKISIATSGEKHRLFGKHHSLETKQKIKFGNTGKKKNYSIEGKERYLLSRKNQKASLKTPQYRENMSKLTSGERNPRYKNINKEEFIKARETMTIQQMVKNLKIGKGTIYNKIKEFNLK